jgi:L-lysine exporter family protein LysE/ArgO
MEFLFLGFITSLSLILAIGPQNIFVIEQGLKKQYVFIVCLICSVSDGLLIFLGLFLFHYFDQYFNSIVELTFNIILVIFLIHFIYSKIKIRNNKLELNQYIEEISLKRIILKTLGFTYLNPHVYSDTIIFLGNFSKNFFVNQKILYGVGASIASFLFFFLIGYFSMYLSRYTNIKNVWIMINTCIIIFIILIIIYVLRDIFKDFSYIVLH